MKSIRINVEEEATWGPAADEDLFRWAWDADPTSICISVSAATCYGPVELDDNANWATVRHERRRGARCSGSRPT
jgi:hypothetical protein